MFSITNLANELFSSSVTKFSPGEAGQVVEAGRRSAALSSWVSNTKLKVEPSKPPNGICSSARPPIQKIDVVEAGGGHAVGPAGPGAGAVQEVASRSAGAPTAAQHNGGGCRPLVRKRGRSR